MKRLFALLIASVCIMAVYALEVDRKELQSESGDGIEFINYTGPQSLVNTAEEIRAIGSELGQAIAQNRDSVSTAGNQNRYYVIHAVDPDTVNGLDADILMLGALSSVDHIDNLRRIISSYLISAYGYTQQDARTLAVYITVYNAVYRGKIDVFSKRYKPIVIGYLNADKAGLSVRYSEWPGRSQIVIPLSEARLAGTLSTIDTTTLSTKEVTENLREDGKAGLDTRKDMVDIKERERDAAEERAQTAQKDAAQAKSDAQTKKEEAAQADKAAKEARTEAESARKEAAAKPTDSEAQRIAEEKKKEADKAESEAQQKKEEASAAEKTVEEKQSEAEKDQKLADTKQQEAVSERKEIASDVQKEVDSTEEEKRKMAAEALATATPAVALRIVDKASLLSELVIVNLVDGKVLASSPLNTVRNRILLSTGNTLMAVAGKKSGSGAVRLVLVNPDTLEIAKQGEDPIAEQSMLVQNGNDYFAVVEQDGSTVLGRFNKDLELKVKSSLQILPETAMTVTANGILVQDIDGRIRLLRYGDLVELP